MLTEGFQVCAAAILTHLARLDVEEEDHRMYDAACRHFRNALNHTHRVKDLLAADEDLFKRRQAS